MPPLPYNYLTMSFLSKVFYINKRDIFIAGGAILAMFVAVTLTTYTYFAKDLTSKERIMNKNDTGITLLDDKEQPFFTFYATRQKQLVKLDEIPLHVQQGVIAVEDKEFYYHPGFSIRGIIRSLLINLREKEIMYGGSTITQQLVKNSLLSPKKSFLRKYQEIIIAHEIERRYSKEEILEMYLNSVYFGQGAFGIEEAAERYFGKKAYDLTLPEGSFLISLLPSPSQAANGDSSQIKTKQNIVLTEMLKEEFITKQQLNQALSEELIFSSESQSKLNKWAPHFAIMVRDELIKNFGEEFVARSGFKVKTSLNLDWQMYAEEAVARHVANLSRNRVSNGASVVIDPKTGEIKALVGSIGWGNEEFGKVNVTTSTRQPGSAFKPIVYAKAFEENLITPATILRDRPVVYKEANNYKPKNFDNKFRGPVTVRRALANSLNVPSVEVMAKVGVSDAIEMANKLGITTLKNTSDYGLSLVLGAGEVKLLELTSAYSTFANSGERNEPVAILEIENKLNQTIYTHKKSPKQVLSPAYSFLISSILSDTRQRAEVFGRALNISRPAAVKTGTTENFRDSLTIGYTPSLAIGVWVGNNDGAPMDNVAGSLGAAPIWRQLMEEFTRGTAIEEFIPPYDIVKLTICTKTATFSASVEYFIKGRELQEKCTPTSTPQNPTSSPDNSTPTQPQPTAPPPESNQEENNNGGNNKENNKNKNEKENTKEIENILKEALGEG